MKKVLVIVALLAAVFTAVHYAIDNDPATKPDMNAVMKAATEAKAELLDKKADEAKEATDAQDDGNK